MFNIISTVKQTKSIVYCTANACNLSWNLISLCNNIFGLLLLVDIMLYSNTLQYAQVWTTLGLGDQGMPNRSQRYHPQLNENRFYESGPYLIMLVKVLLLFLMCACLCIIPVHVIWYTHTNSRNNITIQQAR